MESSEFLMHHTSIISAVLTMAVHFFLRLRFQRILATVDLVPMAPSKSCGAFMSHHESVRSSRTFDSVTSYIGMFKYLDAKSNLQFHFADGCWLSTRLLKYNFSFTAQIRELELLLVKF